MLGLSEPDREGLEARGLYPYGSKPFKMVLGHVRLKPPLDAINVVVDEAFVKWVVEGIYETVLHLSEIERIMPPHGQMESETLRAFLLRLKAWCIRHRGEPDQQDTGTESLTPTERAILIVLDKTRARLLNKTIRHWLKTDKMDVPRGEQKVKESVQALEKLGLVDRSVGDRSGAAITSRGIARLHEMAASSETSKG